MTVRETIKYKTLRKGRAWLRNLTLDLSLPYRLPAATTILYALFGMTWILVSDTGLHHLHLAPDAERSLQTFKGWLYVGLSSAFIFGLLVFAGRRILRHRLETERTHDRLDLALTAGRGAVIEIDLTNQDLYLSPHGKKLLGIETEGDLSKFAWHALIHPDDLGRVMEVIRRVYANPSETHSVQFRAAHADGHYLWISASGQAGCDELGVPSRILGVVFDVTDSREALDQVEHLINYDSLTGLPNRMLFTQQLTEAMGAGPGRPMEVLCARINIIGFAEVHNSFGWSAGDRLLRAVAKRLGDCVGQNGLAARFGEEHFALFIPGRWGGNAAQKFAWRMMEALGNKYSIAEQDVTLTFHMGLALSPQDGAHAGDLVTNADLAAHAVTRKSGGRVSFYASGMDDAYRQRASLSRALHRAIDADALTLAYQPIVAAEDGSLVGFEALARWTDPEMGVIPPGVFIPLAEETGLIGRIGESVLRQACRTATQWSEAAKEPLRMAVNVSPAQLDADDFVETVMRTLADTGCPPDALELEITESMLMAEVECARDQLARLRDLGVRIVVDDFGTGYSSLSVLRTMSVSKLKIDQIFVRDLDSDPQSAAVVRAILELSQSLGLDVTAEGVETESQLRLLRTFGCTTVQGYFLARPMEHAEAQQWWEGRRAAPRIRKDLAARRRTARR